MGKFQVTLIRPQGYLHSEAFREIAETLQFGLRSLGHSAGIAENAVDRTATNLILGAHLLSPKHVPLIPQGSIIYNLEQLPGEQLPRTYEQLARRHQIWDYSQRNIEIWKNLACGFAPVHVPVGYVPELTRIPAAPTQDIDVLFYGSLNERRNRILKELKNLGINVHAVFGVYGRERDELISRSKIILNLHYYEAKLFEIVRVSYLLANSKAIVTECAADTAIEEGLSEGVLAVPYDSLVEACQSLLQDEDRRRNMESAGFQWFSQRKEAEILRAALEQCTGATPTNLSPIPRKLNLGSGKDWREDCLNLDCDPHWQPDLLWDLNRPLPFGQPLQTQRFGTVVLQKQSFDEVIASDVLQQLPNLTMAISSCLHLLKVGGALRINVPYDLSYEAWQDPTHVRAFNERSWLHYTDYFWKMGWTEARFDLVQFELVLSPTGKALAKQIKGEDLVRYPRAVERLGVVLRKRLLTAVEQQQAANYLTQPSRRISASSQVARANGKASFDLFDTLVASRSGRPAGDCLDELFPIVENIAKVKPEDLIVSDYYNPAGAEKVLRSVAGLQNELIVTAGGKYSGEVWPKLVERGVSCHHGDNLTSDVLRPQQHGVRATLCTASQFTECENFVRQSGFGAIAGAMREARLTSATKSLQELWRLQTQVNFPFLLIGAIGVLRKARAHNCKTILMSSRDCVLWKDAVEFLARTTALDVRVEYFLTSRITRVFPSASYLSYVNQFLGDRALFVDLDGTGWSLRRLVAHTVRPQSPVLLLVRVKDSAQEAEQEQLAATVECPLEWLTTGYEIALEPANYAKHAMVKDVDANGQAVFTNPTGFDWAGSPEIQAQHRAFGLAQSKLSYYRVANDLDVPDTALSNTLGTILGWYRGFAGAVDFQRATFQAEHNHVFSTLRESAARKQTAAQTAAGAP